MRGITITKQTNVNLTADQWELYTVGKPAESQIAAGDINRAITDAFNQGLSRSEVAAAALKVMHNHGKAGAMDSEPIRKLEEVLDDLFGKSGEGY